MAKFLRLYSFVLASLLIFSFAFVKSSYADVIIKDMNVSGNDNNGLTSGVIDIGSKGFSYELLFCAIETDGANPFNSPFQGSWQELNNSMCDSPVCHLGIWGRTAEPSQSEDVTCSWADDTRAFAAGSIRFEGVDTNDPIIDLACSEFIDGLFVLDSLSSEPGAQIVSVQLQVRSGSSEDEFAEFDAASGAFAAAINFTDNRILSLGTNSRIDPQGLGQEGFSIPPLLDIFETKFCVLSLRMATRNIPTMSEWGTNSYGRYNGDNWAFRIKKKKNSGLNIVFTTKSLHFFPYLFAYILLSHAGKYYSQNTPLVIIYTTVP